MGLGKSIVIQCARCGIDVETTTTSGRLYCRPCKLERDLEARRVPKSPSEPKPAPDPEQLELSALLTSLKRTNNTLQMQLAAAKARTEDLVTATYQGAFDATVSLGPLITTPAPDVEYATDGSPETALWHLTDWQGAKVTTSYNSAKMVERVRRFCSKAELITGIQRAHHPVHDCVILFGGDMVEGLFNYPTQPFEIDATIFVQFTQTARLLVEVVQYALGLYRTVKVVAEWGNHGRIGSKRDAVPRSDNIDRMTYELARQLLSQEPRLEWEDSAEDIQRVEVGNYRALLIHGDEIGRTGFASPTTIVQHVNRWRSGAYGWDFRDVYMGHYHTHAEWPLANGRGAVYQTGSTESDNRYAREMMAASAIPTQRLHFIDNERGRIASQYKIWLEE